MDVGSVRRGIQTVLSEIPGTSVHATITRQVPATGTATAIVVEPGSPYVTYADSAGGNIRQATLRFVLLIIPATVDMTEAQQRIDDYLSAGAASGEAQARSVYDRLHGHQTLDGTACMVNVLTADVVSIVRNVERSDGQTVEVQWPAGQMQIEVLVRTR